jgi:hippurate hydrolase
MIQDKIKELAFRYANEFEFMPHPAHLVSFSEFETSEFVQEKLKSWDIEYKVMAVTGVVAIIKGENPGEKIIALRADMDALPIKELNDIEYRSKNNGIMHACGHDVHTTCLLGAAKILNELKEEWTGTVKLIFQPGEEKNRRPVL